MIIMIILKLINGNNYDYSKSIYIKAITKITIKCNKCEYEFKQLPNSHLRGIGCPHCKKSHGEKRIARFLKKLNINFEIEKHYNNLRGEKNGLLRYDFYLLDFNTLIEYDGQQHFDRIFCNKYYGRDYYDTLKIHDHKKSRYCRKHGIKLIRIPYWDKSKIEKILGEKLINKIELNQFKKVA